MTHAQIGGVMLDIYCEILTANEIHGTWDNYDRGDVCKAISDEYVEYMEAYIADDIHGSHGQLRELTQLACVAIKGIISLRRDNDQA